MKHAGVRLYVVLAAIAGAVSACGIISGSSDEPGLYAMHADGEIQRLDGDPEWESDTWEDRANFAPGVRFMVVHPALPGNPAEQRNMIHLRKVGWVRSEVGSDGEIGPVEGTRWVAPDLGGYDVPLRYVPVSNGGGSLQVEPVRPLEPGLYSLVVGRGAEAKVGRIGVQWSTVNRKNYAGSHCIDRYVGGNGPSSYRPCLEQQIATAGAGLRVHLIPPEETSIDGKSTLIVKGVVVNISDRSRSLPMLQAKLQDQSGKTLYSWLFSVPDTASLSPGQSASFRTSSQEVPQGTANITVDFSGHGPGTGGLNGGRSTDCGPDGCQAAEIVRQPVPPPE